MQYVAHRPFPRDSHHQSFVKVRFSGRQKIPPIRSGSVSRRDVHLSRVRLSLRLDRAPKVEEKFSNRGGEPVPPKAQATSYREAAVQRKAAVIITSGPKNNEL